MKLRKMGGNSHPMDSLVKQKTAALTIDVDSGLMGIDQVSRALPGIRQLATQLQKIAEQLSGSEQMRRNSQREFPMRVSLERCWDHAYQSQCRIVINPLQSKQELCFAIGHEVGHLAHRFDQLDFSYMKKSAHQ